MIRGRIEFREVGKTDRSTQLGVKGDVYEKVREAQSDGPWSAARGYEVKPLRNMVRSSLVIELRKAGRNESALATTFPLSEDKSARFFEKFGRKRRHEMISLSLIHI